MAYQRGDVAEALGQAMRQSARWKDPNSPWFWDFRLLSAEALTALARYNEADAILKQEPPPHPELSQRRARLLIDRANLRVIRSQDASGLLAEARAATTDPELAIRLELVSGTFALDRRRHEEARDFFRAALELAVKRGSGYYQGLALNNLSFATKRLNRYEESIDYGLRALQAAEKAGAKRVMALAYLNLGASYAYLGQFEAALENEQKAVQMNEAMGARASVMTGLGELALIYDRADRVAEAIPIYQRAYALACELKAQRDAARFAENLALALIKSKEWDQATEWNDRAWDLAVQSGAKANLPYLLRNRAYIALGRGQFGEAARLTGELLRTNAEQPHITWEAHELLGEISASTRRFGDANRDIENALHVIEGTRLDVLDPRYRITLLSRLIKFYREYVDALVVQSGNVQVVQRGDVQALRVVESSRARVLAERLNRDFQTGRFPDAEGLRAFARQSHAALLSFWIAPKRSFAWLVTANEVRRFELPPADELESLVTEYRKLVEHSAYDPLSQPAGRALWDKLMAPIAPKIPKGSRVIVIPDGPLHRLNLETLVAPSPEPHYWIEDVEIAISPSIAIAMSQARRTNTDRSLLLIGAPDYAGTGYEPLPGAAAEVQDLRTQFAKVSPAVFTGSHASPAAYRAADPAKYSVIHFAAHAEANVVKPLESAVVLSPGGGSFKLYASDVIDIPLHAELVTLSACRSAGSRAYAGEGLMGFAWAFLQAGARAVVAGLWDVSDGSTGPLMSKFYSEIAEGRDVVAALREAKLAMLKGGSRRKAYYWGAFQVYEGGIASPPSQQ